MAISFRGGVTAPVVVGNDATTQTLFCVENGIASRVNVLIRELHTDLDPIGAVTAVMPLVKTSRGTGISGGIILAKGTLDTALTSDPAVVFRSAMGETAPITATPGDVVFSQFLSRMHTAAEQSTLLQNEFGTSCLPYPLTAKDFVLRPGQSLIVRVVAAAGTSNAALNNYYNAACVWEEDPIATFAISGTVTLSGSPVSGARVVVVEADDIDMTNAVLREVIITPAGGTWASSIRTGKVGAAYVQYRVGATYYTAPGSPYLA
jgi:hypothetical protein